MTRETINKVLAIHQERGCLERVKEVLRGKKEHRLCYIEEPYSTMGCSNEWRIVNMDIMKFIGDILDRHDLQIRQEIDNRIEELEKELEELWRQDWQTKSAARPSTGFPTTGSTPAG